MPPARLAAPRPEIWYVVIMLLHQALQEVDPNVDIHPGQAGQGENSDHQPSIALQLQQGGELE